MPDRTRRKSPSYANSLRVWWAFTWRSALFIGLGAIALGILVGLVRLVIPLSVEGIQRFTSFCTFIIVIGAQIEAFRRILKLDLPGYSVRLMEKHK